VLFRSQKSGLVLIVLGRFQDGCIEPRLMLPGKKIKEGYQPPEVCSAFLNSELNILKSWLEVDPDFATSVEEMESQTFGIQSVYRKATFKVAGRAGLPWKKAAVKISRFRSPMVLSPSSSLTSRHNCGGDLMKSPKAPVMYTLRPAERRATPDTDKVDIYAWLPVWEYEWIRSSTIGRATLQEWLGDIDIPAHLMMLQEGSGSMVPLSSGVSSAAMTIVTSTVSATSSRLGYSPSASRPPTACSLRDARSWSTASSSGTPRAARTAMLAPLTLSARRHSGPDDDRSRTALLRGLLKPQGQLRAGKL